MQQNLSILNNRYNKFDYSKDRSKSAPAIELNSDAAQLYEEATTEDITEVYERNKMNNLMNDIFLESKWKEKYSEDKKVEKCDMSELFYFFHDKLSEKTDASESDIFCTIAEFFELNYNVLYNDILTISTKIKVLNALNESRGIGRELKTRKERLY